jgi:hypothetical protein
MLCTSGAWKLQATSMPARDDAKFAFTTFVVLALSCDECLAAAPLALYSSVFAMLSQMLLSLLCEHAVEATRIGAPHVSSWALFAHVHKPGCIPHRDTALWTLKVSHRALNCDMVRFSVCHNVFVAAFRTWNDALAALILNMVLQFLRQYRVWTLQRAAQSSQWARFRVMPMLFLCM